MTHTVFTTNLNLSAADMQPVGPDVLRAAFTRRHRLTGYYPVFMG